MMKHESGVGGFTSSWTLGATTTLVILTTFLSNLIVADGIGCFVCYSLNGSDPGCEDPFNSTLNASTLRLDRYMPDCLAGKKERQGLFPASHCVKVSGTYWDTGETLVVRTCGLDSNEQTADVEMVRVPHTCGIFKFEANEEEQKNPKKRKLNGCIEVCDGPDGCNGAPAKNGVLVLVMFLLLTTLCSNRGCSLRN